MLADCSKIVLDELDELKMAYPESEKRRHELLSIRKRLTD
jgi:hypothetical protein